MCFHTNTDGSGSFLEINRINLLKVKNSLLIFPLNNYSIQFHKIFQQINSWNNVIFYKIPLVKGVENKILYINFQIDRLDIVNNIH